MNRKTTQAIARPVQPPLHTQLSVTPAIAMREQSSLCNPTRVIPFPCPASMALYQNVNRDSLMFLQAAEIQPKSKEYKELRTTIQALCRQHLDPFKYVEEQSPGRVDRLIANAKTTLPWLIKYEACWPARVYLKRYVDTRRPHLRCTRYELKKMRAQNSCVSHNTPTKKPQNKKDMLDCDPILREFLDSLAPSLEHHLNAFAELGVKDQTTLEAFLSWPQETREQFLDEGHGVLRLTALEKRGLLLGCALFTQKALRGSLAKIGCFHP